MPLSKAITRANVDPDLCRHMASIGHSEVKVNHLPETSGTPDSKVHGANMGPTWVLSAPDGPMLAPLTLLSGRSFNTMACGQLLVCVILVLVLRTRRHVLYLLSIFVVDPWWRHQMETYSALLAICEGIPPVTVGFRSHKGQWRGALMVSLICKF